MGRGNPEWIRKKFEREAWERAKRELEEIERKKNAPPSCDHKALKEQYGGGTVLCPVCKQYILTTNL